MTIELLHSCMADCGGYVWPDADGGIPAFCAACTPSCPTCGAVSLPQATGWRCTGPHAHRFTRVPVVRATARPDFYTCDSFTSAATYRVDLRFRYPRCACPDYQRHAYLHGYTCKHGAFAQAAVVAGTVQPAIITHTQSVAQPQPRNTSAPEDFRHVAA